MFFRVRILFFISNFAHTNFSSNMTQKFCIVSLLVLFFAQQIKAFEFDVIITNSREQIQCIILEESNGTISYVLYGDQNNSVRKISRADIQKIYPRDKEGAIKMRSMQARSNTKIEYFSDFAKPKVEKEINEWQQKDEFEKIADWKKRVNENTRAAKIKELTKQCEREYIEKYSKSITLNVMLDGLYDSENEVFLLSDSTFGNMIVSVPIEEGRAFKQNWNSAQLTPQYFIENDVLSLASLKIYFPTTNKQYLYSNKSSLKYELAQVDYNFNPIEIPVDQGSSKGNQTISERKISNGKSSVDIQIPENKISNSNTFVVIIANEDYKSVASVPYALNDGRILAKYCQRTLGIPSTNIKIHENATYNDMRLAIAWLKNVCDKYEGEASVLFYYAGHGIPDASDKSAYLLPVDGDGRYVQTAYKLDELYQKLGNMPTKTTTVLLDACFSGANRDGKMLSAERGVALKSRPGQPQGNMVIFSAAQGDETALPNDEEGHGMFTYYILKKLQETKGDITLSDLSSYVIREVGKKSAVSNKPQTPSITPAQSVATTWQNWKLK